MQCNLQMLCTLFSQTFCSNGFLVGVSNEVCAYCGKRPKGSICKTQGLLSGRKDRGKILILVYFRWALTKLLDFNTTIYIRESSTL